MPYGNWVFGIALVVGWGCGGSEPVDPTRRLTSLVLSTGAIALPIGDSLFIEASPRDNMGTAIPGLTVAWGSASPSIVTVTPQGASSAMMHAVGLGLSEITASVSRNSESAASTVGISVVQPALASLSVSQSAVSLVVGDSVIVTGTPRAANAQALAGVPVTWQSANTGVATATSGSGNTMKIKAIAVGSTSVEGTAQQSAITRTANIAVSVITPEAVTPLFVLDPCDFADSSAMWGSGKLLTVDQGSNIGNHRPTIDATVGSVPWNPSCARAFLHRYNFLNSEAQAAYDWPFAGSIGTTKRVYYRVWVRMSDSLRVARDWKTMFLLVNEVNFANPRFRVSIGHEATTFSEWMAGTINSKIDLGMQLTALPILPAWQERGEIPPKGIGRFDGQTGHRDADAPDMRNIAFTGQWRLLCVYQTTPDTPTGSVAMKMWNNGVLYNDSDASASLPSFIASDSMHLRFFNKFTFGRNGELFFVNPSNEAVIRQTGYVHSGRVEIFNQRPSTGCGS